MVTRVADGAALSLTLPGVKGAIAAGHPLTAEAGAEVLREGGNAVDACLGAAFVSWVAESPLTGPGGGGFMLVYRARDGTASLYDFFAALPGAGLAPGWHAELEQVDVDFDGSTHQIFNVGAASVAVPGAALGLESVHRRFGSRPWAALIEPAIALARSGVELTRSQAYLHELLDLILRHTEGGRAIYGPAGGRLTAGERLVMSDLAGTLEALRDRGAQDLYTGELGRLIAADQAERGGAVTAGDLAAYRVIRRRPIDADFLGHRFLSNPPPSSGGVLIAYGLRLLDRLGLGGPAGSADAVSALAEVMREQAWVRGGTFSTDLYRGGLAARLGAEEALEAALQRIAAGRPSVREGKAAWGTTHISVVDARGNAASLTATTGAGSGVIVPGTGIHLNNMLGEYDLNPPGREGKPGTRMTSMMAPSLVLEGERPRLVVGSAGSLRLRGAIMQIVVNVVGHGHDVEEAICAPRVHLDDGHLHCEGGADTAALDELERRGYDVVRWRRPNLYFGGAAAVELLEDGTLAAAGDPRRGGHGVVVRA
jgi:gamma-glutamyltranspeptidase / glutathione hydrolase